MQPNQVLSSISRKLRERFLLLEIKTLTLALKHTIFDIILVVKYFSRNNFKYLKLFFNKSYHFNRTLGMNSPGLHRSHCVVRGRRPAGMGALWLFWEPEMSKQKGGKLCKWQTRIRQVKFLALKLRLWWAAAGRSPWACSARCQHVWGTLLHASAERCSTRCGEDVNYPVIYFQQCKEKKITLPEVYASFLRVYPDFNYLNVNT